VALLVACSSAPAPRRPRTVAALGDSLTQGTSSNLPGIETPYPASLERLLGPGWSIANLGVAGYRAIEVRRAWRERARGKGFAVAVVLAGANDLRVGTSAEEIWAELRPTYEEILADGLALVAVTATPFRGWRFDPWTPAKQAQLEELNRRIAAFCGERGCAVVDAYAAFLGPGECCALAPEFDVGDHLHLSQAGLDRLAALVHPRVAAADRSAP
jgi:lysophospholipase L1-like esterase